MSPSNALFLADSFVKAFGQNRVLKAASVWTRAGRVTVLMGRNGSGKSTLIRCALGLCRPDQGVLRFDGVPYLRPRLWVLAAQGLSYVPDRGLLSRRMKLRDQLDLVRIRFGVGDYGDIIGQLQVERLLDAFPDEMSGGELRRADLAFAFTRRPTCLIADEPLTEIEPKDRALIMEMFKTQAASNTAVLITGHEVRDLLSLSDEVVWMAAGTTHGLGSPEEARAHDQFRKEYLGPRGV